METNDSHNSDGRSVAVARTPDDGGGEGLRLRVQMLDPSLAPPAYANEGDNGLDLRSRIDAVIEAGERCIIPTGVAVAIEDGWAGLLTPRSGLAAKHGISIVNSPGLIDSSYRGELMAIILNTGERDFRVRRGDRVCQLVLVMAPQAQIIYVDDLAGTARGAQGLGSSGRH